MLETLDYTICIGSTSTILYFGLRVVVSGLRGLKEHPKTNFAILPKLMRNVGGGGK